MTPLTWSQEPPTECGPTLCQVGVSRTTFSGFVTNETDDYSLQFHGVNWYGKHGTWPVASPGILWCGPIPLPAEPAAEVAGVPE